MPETDCGPAAATIRKSPRPTARHVQKPRDREQEVMELNSKEPMRDVAMFLHPSAADNVRWMNGNEKVRMKRKHDHSLAV
jgi:hypothetical protein